MDVLQTFQPKLFFALKVMVNTPFDEAARLGYIRHGRVEIAMHPEQVDGIFDYLLSAGFYYRHG